MKNYSAAAATAADGPQKKIKYRKVLKGNFYVKCADNTYLPVKAKNGLNSKVSLICFSTIFTYKDGSFYTLSLEYTFQGKIRNLNKIFCSI